MSKLLDRISVDPEQCGGRPCVRGLRIRVTDVLSAYPYLEPDDISACLLYAVRRLDHPTIAA
jgi:uncharacterized protein (DUF433 family)